MHNLSERYRNAIEWMCEKGRNGDEQPGAQGIVAEQSHGRGCDVRGMRYL